MKIRHKFIVLVLSTLLLSGCNSDYKLSAVSCITKSEAVEFIVNALKSDPNIPTFNAKQGTIDGYTAETPAEAESTGGNTVILEEDEYQGDDPNDKVVTEDEYEGMTDDEIVDQMIADFIKEHAEDNIAYDPNNLPPGCTPGDPSQDGQYHLGQGGELPDHLKGAVMQ